MAPPLRCARILRSFRSIWGQQLLKLKDVHASYGQVPALHGVSLEVPEAQIVTVLGANGAGKSTVIRTIAGLSLPPPSILGVNA